jgi:hypothetical protein
MVIGLPVALSLADAVVPELPAPLLGLVAALVDVFALPHPEQMSAATAKTGMMWRLNFIVPPFLIRFP